MGKCKLAYLAGIIDGEGTLNINFLKSRNEYRLRFYVVNTDRRLIDWLKENFGGSVYIRDNSKYNPKWKTKYEWTCILGKGKTNLLKLLQPYLVTKKEQSVLAIEFLLTIGKKGEKLSKEILRERERLYQDMKKLYSKVWVVAETE